MQFPPYIQALAVACAALYLTKKIIEYKDDIIDDFDSYAKS